MSIDFQNSNAMVSAVRPASRSKKAARTSRSRRDSDWDFAALLAGQEVQEADVPEVLRGVPGLGRNLPLDPALFMQQLYGREFDPLTGRVNHGLFLQQTQEKTTRLATDLQASLTEQGLDLASALPLVVDDGGTVMVEDDSLPNAEQINTLFAENFDLAQGYRNVAQAHHWAALTEIGSAYVEAWYSTDDYDIRDDITDQFRAIFDGLAAVSSHMTFENGGFESLSISQALQALDSLAGPPPEAEAETAPAQAQTQAETQAAPVPSPVPEQPS